MVVDDGSPDGTGAARRCSSRGSSPAASTSCTAPEAAASAVRTSTACSSALADRRDVHLPDGRGLSHDPKYLPAMVGGVRRTHDMVIGSRYLNGVSVVNWPLRRIILSAFANRYIRAVTRAAPARLHQRLPLLAPRGAREAAARRDGLGRLRVPRRDALRGAPPRRRIGEVPIIFVERRHGLVEDVEQRDARVGAHAVAAEPAVACSERRR